MATCPRCLRSNSDGHRCRPIWIKRFRGQVFAALLGGLFGGFVHLLLVPEHVPVMGFVIGGLLSFGLNEAIRRQ